MRFYADDAELELFGCVLGEVNTVATSELDRPYLSSEFGGRQAAARGTDGRLLTTRAVYRAQLRECTQRRFPKRVVTAVVQITAHASSIAECAWNVAYGVFLGESGI